MCIPSPEDEMTAQRLLIDELDVDVVVDLTALREVLAAVESELAELSAMNESPLGTNVGAEGRARDACFWCGATETPRCP